MVWAVQAAGTARTPGPGVGTHPLTALHLTAAELATGLGVDEGPLTCLHLQVCVIGQALLSLFSAVGEGWSGAGRDEPQTTVLWYGPHTLHSTICYHHNHQSLPELGVQLCEQESGESLLLPSQLGDPRSSGKDGGSRRGEKPESCSPAYPVHAHPPATHAHLSLHR